MEGNNKEQPGYKRLGFIVTSITLAVLILIGSTIGIAVAVTKDKDNSENSEIPTSDEIENLVTLPPIFGGMELYESGEIPDLSIFNYVSEYRVDYYEGSASYSRFVTYNKEEKYLQYELDVIAHDVHGLGMDTGYDMDTEYIYGEEVSFDSVTGSGSDRIYLENGKRTITSDSIYSGFSLIDVNDDVVNQLTAEKFVFGWVEDSETYSSNTYYYSFKNAKTDDQSVDEFTIVNTGNDTLGIDKTETSNTYDESLISEYSNSIMGDL